MVTALTSPNASFPTSASYFVRNGDSEGFVDVAACVTVDGHGYDSRNSQPCECQVFVCVCWSAVVGQCLR
jgi:hypothetical protein